MTIAVTILRQVLGGRLIYSCLINIQQLKYRIVGIVLCVLAYISVQVLLAVCPLFRQYPLK